MGETTKIGWTDHTFNPWVGCTKVSPACDNCYAEGWAKRAGRDVWGHGKPRQRTKTWDQPEKWNAAAAAEGERRRVFCASLADVFDTEVRTEWRADLMVLIEKTPNLDWLLLTKRPKVMAEFFDRHPPPDNVWAGTTVESQKMAALRIPQLLKVPARIRFLSVEPMLEAIDLWKVPGAVRCCGTNTCATVAEPHELCEVYSDIDWIICGGESGPNHRPIDPDWVRDLHAQTVGMQARFFFKQWGGRTPDAGGKLLDGREHCEFPS